MTTITFQGTGDAMGVPRMYCSCGVCEEARASGLNRRLRSAIHLIDQEFGSAFIDCGPDFGKQMEASGLRSVDRILLTHAHFDHIGGLVEWADACRWTRIKGEAYAPFEVIKEIADRFPWLDRQINFHSIDKPMRFGPWETSCWRVNHGKNGYSYAFRFDHTSTGNAWAYCSDSIALTQDQKLPLYGLELLILGTSFYKEPFPFETRSVYDVAEAGELIREVKPERTIFTHLSHDIDLNTDYAMPGNAIFARTGLSVEIG